MTDHTPARHSRIQYPRLRTVVGATALAAGLSFAPIVAPAGSAFFTAAGPSTAHHEFAGQYLHAEFQDFGSFEEAQRGPARGDHR